MPILPHDLYGSSFVPRSEPIIKIILIIIQAVSQVKIRYYTKCDKVR